MRHRGSPRVYTHFLGQTSFAVTFREQSACSFAGVPEVESMEHDMNIAQYFPNFSVNQNYVLELLPLTNCLSIRVVQSGR